MIRQSHRIAVPSRLVDKLAGFRRALIRLIARDTTAWVWLVGLTVLAVMSISDRLIETPTWFRCGLLGAIITAIGIGWIRVWKTIWACRSPLTIAKVLRQRDPVFGDHLVGALELSESESEQARSAQLCAGALEQVADEAGTRDFQAALPDSTFRFVAIASASLSVLLLMFGLLVPDMIFNTAVRLFNPLSPTPRYTLVRLGSLPDQVVVPRDESYQWTVDLDPRSRWTPSEAVLWIESRRIDAPLTARDDASDAVTENDATTTSPQMRYRFELPRMYEPVDADLRVGDTRTPIRLIPKLRPELTGIAATVGLPDYLSDRLGKNETRSEVSAGSISVVEGATVTLHLTASSSLAAATADGRHVDVRGNAFSAAVDQRQEVVQLNWTDRDGLRARQPMTVTVHRVADQRPTLLVENEVIPSRVLDSQSLQFSVLAQDDFAIRRVGMQWTSGDESGERVLGPGDDDSTVAAVFQATALSAPPGKVSLRFWAEDDYPGRPRVYSEPSEIHVLTPDEHAVWIAGQFARWRQSAMDVRDRELNLFSRNRELSEVAAEDRDADWHAAVAQQARAEEFNGRQLRSLAAEGEEMLRQAARNEQVAVDYVEKLAATIKSLEELADEGMPRVAKLLNDAAERQQEESKFAEMANQESSQGTLQNQTAGNAGDDSESGDDAESPEQLGLAGTTIVDTSKRTGKTDAAEESEQDSLKIAVEDQTDLVAQFDSVAEELRELLGNMEGSTLVKRLKAVSRLQDRVAMQLAREIETTFGKDRDENTAVVRSVTTDVAEAGRQIRTVLDDLEAFCKRREIEHFESVLTEMKDARVLEQLKGLESRVAARPATSIAIAEYWSDNLDRWADDLVDPGSEQQQSGPQNNKSLSPAIIVEVLRILEAEVNLREQTRIADQGRDAMEPDVYRGEAIRLSESQDLLRDRLDAVVDSIEALPEGAVHFADDIEVLGLASAAMVDATKTLVTPETGPVAIAAQTEAIELLLRSNKVSPEGGDGGGGSAGGGTGGETDQAAIALLGRGLNARAVQRESDTQLSFGRDRRGVPERWREGLDQYFDALERRRLRQERGGTR